MIKGKIENGLHPKVRVEVAGKIAFKKFSALVDTGFDLDVALHHNEAAKLGLKADDFVWVRYANGKRTKEPYGLGRVLWHGKWKEVEVVLSNDDEPAVGTGLLQGSVATLDFVKNRLVIAEPRRKR
jgi:predicted aspartyl protease